MQKVEPEARVIKYVIHVILTIRIDSESQHLKSEAVGFTTYKVIDK